MFQSQIGERGDIRTSVNVLQFFLDTTPRSLGEKDWHSFIAHLSMAYRKGKEDLVIRVLKVLREKYKGSIPSTQAEKMKELLEHIGGKADVKMLEEHILPTAEALFSNDNDFVRRLKNKVKEKKAEELKKDFPKDAPDAIRFIVRALEGNEYPLILINQLSELEKFLPDERKRLVYAWAVMELAGCKEAERIRESLRIDRDEIVGSEVREALENALKEALKNHVKVCSGCSIHESVDRLVEAIKTLEKRYNVSIGSREFKPYLVDAVEKMKRRHALSFVGEGYLYAVARISKALGVEGEEWWKDINNVAMEALMRADDEDIQQVVEEVLKVAELSNPPNYIKLAISVIALFATSTKRAEENETSYYTFDGKPFSLAAKGEEFAKKLGMKEPYSLKDMYSSLSLVEKSELYKLMDKLNNAKNHATLFATLFLSVNLNWKDKANAALNRIGKRDYNAPSVSVLLHIVGSKPSMSEIVKGYAEWIEAHLLEDWKVPKVIRGIVGSLTESELPESAKPFVAALLLAPRRIVGKEEKARLLQKAVEKGWYTPPTKFTERLLEKLRGYSWKGRKIYESLDEEGKNIAKKVLPKRFSH